MKSWEEIIYNNLNKSYGSYQLRKKYAKYLFFSLLISLALFIIPTCIVYYKSKIKNVVENFPYLITVELGQPIDLDVILSPPAPPAEELESNDAEILPLIVDTLKVKPEQIDENKEKLDIKTDSSEIVNNNSKNGNGFNLNGDSAIFYTYIDNYPEFPGGNVALYRFINQNIIYPDSAQRNNIQGVAKVRFTITNNGDTRDISVINLKSINPLLAKEAVRVVSLFPKWFPAKRAGRPVYFRYDIPISFKINYNTKG